jgi:uncharacterized repeat protein (TIGR02543 family)
LNKYIKVLFTRTNGVGSGTELSAPLLIANTGTSCSAAIQTRIPAFRIDWNTNSGIGYMNPQYGYYGSTITLYPNILRRDGYSFSGWNTKADGTGTTYADQDTFKIGESDVVLYAQWKLIQTKPTITWATPIAIEEGTALSSLQLNALASVPGTYTYLPALGTILPVGKNVLKVTFVPTDPKYLTIEAPVELEVLAKAKVIWINPASVTEGTPLTGVQLNATASLPGTFTYSPAAQTVLTTGKQALKVVFTPTDSRLGSVNAAVVIEVTAIIPAPPVSPTYSVAGPQKTTIIWGPGINAAKYSVLVDGRSVCNVVEQTCDVSSLLGPKDVVTVTSVANNGNQSSAVQATYVAPSTPQVLTTINFDSAKSVVKTSELAKLRAFASIVKSAGYTTLTVYGHTDSMTGVDNQKLSINRADATIAYLKKLLPGVTFSVSGFAASEPVADNSTAEGKAANRRAEIFIP